MKKNEDILKNLRNEYILKPNLDKITIKTVSLLECHIENVISEIQSLINDVYVLQIDQHDIKKCKNDDDRIEMISLVQTFKFFRENGVISPNIHDVLWVQKELYCRIAELFIKHNKNWLHIPLPNKRY